MQTGSSDDLRHACQSSSTEIRKIDLYSNRGTSTIQQEKKIVAGRLIVPGKL